MEESNCIKSILKSKDDVKKVTNWIYLHEEKRFNTVVLKIHIKVLTITYLLDIKMEATICINTIHIHDTFKLKSLSDLAWMELVHSIK